MARLICYSIQAKRILLTGIILLFTCVVAAAQGTITGKVTTVGGKTPLGKASVFLNNATFGTTTADDGTFTLRNVRPGQYLLVVTNVGFEEHSETIMVNNELLTLNIEMKAKVMELRDVFVTTPADWKRNYELFKKDFIGTSDNAKQCKVINPRTVNLAYYGSKRLLEAYTDEFLVVENHALGYRVKYMINDFKSDKIDYLISYQGRALFEDLPGSASQKAKWRAKREEAYYGSPKHFFRSLYTGNLEKDGFVVMKFTREDNPQRPPEALLQKKLKQLKNNPDSMNYWGRLGNLPLYYKEHIDRTPLKASEFFYETEKPGYYAISTQGQFLLYVMYTKKREETYFKDLYRPLDLPNYETSVATLFTQYQFFDKNGMPIGTAPLYEGTWSKAKLAEMLPVDYVPGD
jgi:hypothetical protein